MLISLVCFCAFNHRLIYFPIWKCVVAADEVYTGISLANFILQIDLNHHSPYLFIYLGYKHCFNINWKSRYLLTLQHGQFRNYDWLLNAAHNSLSHRKVLHPFYLWWRNRLNQEISNLCWSCFWWQSFFDTLNLVPSICQFHQITLREPQQVLASYCSFVEKLSCQRKCFLPLSLDVQYYMSILAQVLIVTYFHLGGGKWKSCEQSLFS